MRTAKDLKEQIQQKLVGHNSTVDSILKLYDIYVAHLNDKERPICSSLIVGPTGCGKTHLARSFAYALHNDMNCMLRIDCGEFQQKHETARLIGAPPGYLGHRETEAILSAARINAATSKYSPISIILLDEIEKADVSVFDLLLNVLDYGKLTLGTNEIVDFTNSIIFLTSNLGSPISGKTATYTFVKSIEPQSAYKERAARKVKAHFRPEFLNRLTDTFYLDPLTKKQCHAVALRELKRYLSNAPYNITFDIAACNTLVNRSWSSVYGARSLRRQIETSIIHPLSELLLTTKIDRAYTTIHINKSLQLEVTTNKPKLKKADMNLAAI